MIHVYCGDGKGKTTAALGLTLRAIGSGYHVIFAQFMKAWDTGELQVLRQLENLTLLRGDFPSKFSKDYSQEEKEAVLMENNRLFQEALSKIDRTRKTLLVLDEIIGSMNKGLIDQNMVLDYLKNIDTNTDTNTNTNTEIVLTGRNPSAELLDLADYISEIKKIKHPYERGIMARKGIEF